MSQAAQSQASPSAAANSQIRCLSVDFDGIELLFEADHEAVRWRADTFHSKEPDTVAWMRQFQPGEVLLDIGANIGLYTIAAAKARGVQVVAFEPESQNFAQLNRHIVLNGVAEQCVAYPLALSDKTQVDRLYLSQFGLGGSCHTFGESLDYHLQERVQGYAQGSVSMALDDLSESGAIPPPQHIKIDVDGLEHLVLAGGAKLLEQPQLKSVLIELNTHLPEHRDLITVMQKLGFEYSQQQVDMAIRQQGDFAGIGNYVFFRPDSGISFEPIVMHEARPQAVDLEAVVRHVFERFAGLQLELDPYPHFVIDELFPEDYYRLMLMARPSDAELVCLDDTGRAHGYPERFVMQLPEGLQQLQDPHKRRFWQTHLNWFLSEGLMVELLKRLREQIVALGVTKLNVRAEAMFMRDLQGYKIGPHTDSPARLLSMMVYLPEDDQHQHLGTSVFKPLAAGQTCAGHSHHGFDAFQEVRRAPYRPNSAFGFLKTENSFHGVYPLEEAYARDSLVYIVKHKLEPQG